jgi:Zn-dependent peptidase ImmA (M78 family)/DNA-binding XRE family transcriptional regulator
MFNPNRLRIARKRRRLTEKKLAEMSGLTAVTLSRLEKSNRDPLPETVRSLALSLQYPVEFFSGDDIDELDPDAVSFRSLKAMTAREREAALAAGSLAYLFSDWVSARFNLPAADLPDLSHERNPANAARLIRDAWGLGERPISNMVKLLEAKGIRVFSLAENTKNVDAFSCWRNDVPYIFLNTFKSPDHSRLDAGHELAHLILHKHGGPRQDRYVEIEAQNFASSFLMPSEDVKPRIQYVTSIDALIKAKKRWGVSLSAMTYRLHKLGIISDWQNRMLNIQISKRGYRTNEPEPIGRETSVIWRQVFSDLWRDKITREHIASDLFIPASELENLVFGLVYPPNQLDHAARAGPKVRLNVV